MNVIEGMAVYLLFYYLSFSFTYVFYNYSDDFKDILKSFYICDGEIFKFELYIEICLINAYM